MRCGAAPATARAGSAGPARPAARPPSAPRSPPATPRRRAAAAARAAARRAWSCRRRATRRDRRDARPAAATSIARLASAWPATSARSGPLRATSRLVRRRGRWQRRAVAGEPIDDLAQIVRDPHVDTGHQRRLGPVRRATRRPDAPRPRESRRPPAARPAPGAAGRRARARRSTRRRARQLGAHAVAAGQHRHRDGEVEARADLAQVGRQQRDGDPPVAARRRRSSAARLGSGRGTRPPRCRPAR